MTSAPPQQPKPRDQRRKRAAAALRANLRRRKQGEVAELPDDLAKSGENPAKPPVDLPQD